MAGQYFVYVYRDLDGNPVYFGQGIGAERPGAHVAGSHNQAFKAWLAAHPDGYRVEVLGPLETSTMANAVETALISACKPSLKLARTFFNDAEGVSRYRFRSWGVPSQYAERLSLPLGADELRAIARAMGPIMFVRITPKDFDEGDGRTGYDPANPSTDEQLAFRAEAWWQVSRRKRDWAEKPQLSPALLVAVSGAPRRQQVVASMAIDRSAWRNAESMPQGLLKIPVRRDNLDACALRGRPLEPGLDLRFGQFKQDQFKLFDSDGFYALAIDARRFAARNQTSADPCSDSAQDRKP